MLDQERVSTKIQKFQPSLTLGLKALVEERKAKGLPVYDFGLGETKGELSTPIREAGEQAFRTGQTMYDDPGGIPELREEVLKWLGVEKHYDPKCVVITCGAKQSLFNIFLAVCNPADAVLFDCAPWVSYQPLAVAAYAMPILVLPQHDKYAKVTTKDLERNLGMRPHAKLFLLNNPCNPTGQLYEAHEVEALLKVCVEHRIYFVLDRLYWRLLFDGRSYPSPRIDKETLPWVIQVDGLSKNWRRTGGLRIGWSVSSPDIADAMRNLQSHYTAGPAIPTQKAALAAISGGYDNDLVQELQQLRDRLLQETKDIPYLKLWPTPATFYSFWDVRKCFGKQTPEGEVLRTSNDVAKYLCSHAGVVTASGSAFFQEGYLRFSFATTEEQLVAGVQSAKQAMEKLKT